MVCCKDSFYQHFALTAVIHPSKAFPMKNRKALKMPLNSGIDVFYAAQALPMPLRGFAAACLGGLFLIVESGLYIVGRFVCAFFQCVRCFTDGVFRSLCRLRG